MRQVSALMLAAALTLGVLTAGCSGNRDETTAGEDSAGFVDRVNERNSEAAVNYVRTPLNKARGVQDAAAQHLKDIERSE